MKLDGFGILVKDMGAYMEKNGLEPDLSGSRPHHEICLSDARRTAPAKRKQG